MVTTEKKSLKPWTPDIERSWSSSVPKDIFGGHPALPHIECWIVNHNPIYLFVHCIITRPRIGCPAWRRCPPWWRPSGGCDLWLFRCSACFISTNHFHFLQALMEIGASWLDFDRVSACLLSPVRCHFQFVIFEDILWWGCHVACCLCLSCAGSAVTRPHSLFHVSARASVTTPVCWLPATPAPLPSYPPGHCCPRPLTSPPSLPVPSRMLDPGNLMDTGV